MVYPKPGLEYRQRFKLPDNVLRVTKPKFKDYSKIYQLLSEDDLLDIRGPGLAKLDKEEAALFRKEAESNENGAASVAATVENTGQPSSAAEPKKRATLMEGLKNPEELGAVEIDQGKPDDGAGSVAGFMGRNDVLLRKIKKKARSSKGRSSRGKKEKGFEKQVMRIVSSNAATASIVQPEPGINTDSSKENEEEEMGPLKLRLTSDRFKEPLSDMKCSEVAWKVWPNSNTNIVVAAPCAENNAKKLALDGEKIEDSDAVDRMNSGKVEMKLSSLNYVKAKVAWPTKKKPKKSRRGKKSKKASKSSSTLTEASSDNPQNKKRGPYKKRAVSAPSKKVVVKLRRTSRIRKPRLPVEQLTPTQKLRRIRYAIDKHFSKMPGTGYRCPRATDVGHICEGDPKNPTHTWWCLVCHKEELDDNGDVMIGCDNCDDWYHLRCIGVPDEKYPENMKWYCKRCLAREMRAGTFDPAKFPLYIDSEIACE